MRILSFQNNQPVELTLEELFPKPKASAPSVIFCDDDKQYSLKETLSYKQSHLYQGSELIDPMSKIKCSFLANSHLVESKFKRPFKSPNAKIIEQGRWECGAASLAMLLGESLWNVKRSLAKVGWNNDDRGVTSKLLVQAGYNLGYNLIISENVKDNEPCVAIVPSLNVIKKTHAVCWNGLELLDPNVYNSKRRHYSPDWSLNSLTRFEHVIRFKREYEISHE